MQDPLIPPKVSSEAPKTEGIKAEDLKVLSFRYERGGPLGRQTFLSVEHPLHGRFDLGSPIPMSQEAALQWIELTVPVKAFKKGPLDASHHLDAGEKEPSFWADDPLAGLSPEDKQFLIQGLQERAQEPKMCRFCGAVNRGTHVCLECEEML